MTIKNKLMPKSGLASDHPFASVFNADDIAGLKVQSNKKFLATYSCGHREEKSVRSVIELAKMPTECCGCKELAKSDRMECINAGYKECSKCGIVDKLEEFGECSRNKFGYQSQCRSCRNGTNKGFNDPLRAIRSAISRVRNLTKALRSSQAKNKAKIKADRKRRTNLLRVMTGFQLCSKCGDVKGLNSFNDTYKWFVSHTGICRRCCFKKHSESNNGDSLMQVYFDENKEKLSKGAGTRGTAGRLGISRDRAKIILAGVNTGFRSEAWMNKNNKYGVNSHDLDSTWQVDHIYPVASYVDAVKMGYCTAEQALIHCEHISNKVAVLSRYNMEKSDVYDGHRAREPFSDPRGLCKRGLSPAN